MGTRLRSVSDSKPLTPVGGRVLLHRILDNLAAAGVTRSVVVTGYAGDRVSVVARAAGAEVVHNPDWTAPNGVSVLAAAGVLEDRALLVMGDHLASPGLYAAVAGASLADAGLVLGVDRRLGHAWVDEEDVTRVSTRSLAGGLDRIVAIGKGITSYDAYDCGVFLITRELMTAMAGLAQPGLSMPGLSDGVRMLAAAGRAAVLDVSRHDWIDIDDPRALAAAEVWVRG
jgi:1L-myo-inositol 1-phosphate cytidylyltransferase